MTATAIWGFQPFFLNTHVLDLLNANEALFIVLRYMFASFVLLVLLLLTGARRRPRVTEEAGSPRTGLNWWLQAGLMGLCMYISRFTEILSYGPQQETAAFGMIFSIFFVLLWDFKRWVLYSAVAHLPKNRWPRVRSALEQVASPLQSPAELMSWFIQALLVMTAGLFFVYAQEGRLPAGGAFASAIGWALTSSLMLSFFYDLVMTTAPSGTALVHRSQGIIRTQLLVGITGLAFALLHWSAASHDLTNDIHVATHIMRAWHMTDAARYFLGYIVGVTCIAYVIEGVGLSLHDDNHPFGTWRIAAREWASIATTIDPLVSVLIVVPLLALPSTSVNRNWFWVAGAGVFAVGVQSFLRLWLMKSGQLRGRALGAIYTSTTSPDADTSSALRWLSRLMAFRNEISAPITIVSPLSVPQDIYLHLELVLLRSHRFSHQGRLEIRLFAIANGLMLFDPQDSEGAELWRRQATRLMEGTDSELVLVDHLGRLILDESGMYPEAIGSPQLDSLMSGIDEVGAASEDALLVAFVSGRDGHTSGRARDDGKRQRLVWICKSESGGVRAQAARRAQLWGAVLPSEYFRRESALGPITGLDDLGYFVEDRDVVAAPTLPDTVSTVTGAVVFVQAELVAERLRRNLPLPKWLSSPAAEAAPVVLWSELDVSWFVENQLFGSQTVSKDHVPMLSGIGIEPLGSTFIGSQRFDDAVRASLRRWERPADIIVLSDDPTVRDSVWNALVPALIGVRCQFTVPESMEAAVSALTSSNYPLVLFAPTLDGWRHQLDGVEFIQPFISRCDPYLLRLDAPLPISRSWPEKRKIGISRSEMARVFSGHRGVLPDKRESLSYASADEMLEHLKAELAEMSAEIAQGDVRRHCYGLFLTLGARRRTFPSSSRD